MIEKSKLIYRNVMVRLVFMLIHAAGIEWIVLPRLADEVEQISIPRHWIFFDPETAKRHNANTAAIFHKVKAWIEHNRRHGKNQRRGVFWSYNSVRQWTMTEFSWLSERTVQRALHTLVIDGMLVSEAPGDGKALWYSLGDKLAGEGCQLDVRGVTKCRNNNIYTQKHQHNHPTKTATASKTPTVPNVLSPAPAAADTLADTGEFVSQIVQEGQTHGDERNESVDIPGYDDVPEWAREFQAWAVTPRQKTPSPVPRPPSPDELARVRSFLPTMSRAAIDALLARHGTQAVLDLITEAETGAAAGRVRNPQGVVIAGLKNMDGRAA